jgi:hypothetical protein
MLGVGLSFHIAGPDSFGVRYLGKITLGLWSQVLGQSAKDDSFIGSQVQQVHSTRVLEAGINFWRRGHLLFGEDHVMA